MIYQREIEKKYVIKGDSYEYAKHLLKLTHPGAKTYEGVSTDTFWTQKGTDFIRLRRNTSELSVKITDKDTIEDRVEENVLVGDFDTAMRFSTAVFGQPIGTLEKTYFVQELENGVILSLYTVKDDDRVFLEVEGPSMMAVDQEAEELKHSFDMKQEMRSLFQIVFGGVV